MSARTVWIGRVISFLPMPLFLFSAAMKFLGGEAVEQGFDHLGLPRSMRIPLGILELTCSVVYLVPRTAVLGAILMTGYLGGAICTHWRVGENVALHIVIGVMLWLGLWLRDPRLREVLPLWK